MQTIFNVYYGVNAQSEINLPKDGNPSRKIIYFLQLSGNLLFFEIYVPVLCVCICACVSVCEYQLGVHVENNFMP